jgi:hypothetical protein
VDPAVLRAAMAENRSVWVTNGMAVYSVILSFVGFLLNFLFGMGVLPAVPGAIFAYVALNKSKKLNGQGRGLAITGLVLNGLVIAFGVCVWVFLLAAAGSGGGS